MRFRLSSFLTVAVLLTVAVALFFQGWVLLEGHQRALELMRLRAANRAQATAHQVQGLFKHADLLLLDLREHLDSREIAQGPSAASARKAAAVRALFRSRMTYLPQVLAVNVIAPDGRYVYSSFDVIPAISLADRHYVREQQAAKEDLPRISEPLQGRVSQRWGIYTTRRLVAPDGQFAGIIFAVLDAERVGASMMAVDMQQWVLALYDRELRLVARTPPTRPDMGEAIGQVSQDPILRAWREGGHSTFRGSGLGEKQSQLWGIQSVEGLQLFTVAGYSEGRALAQWRNDLHIHIAVAVLLIGGCLGILLLQRRNLLAQRKLHTSESYFRTLFDASPEAIAVVHLDQDGTAEVVDSNARYRELFKLPHGNRTPPWEMAPQKQPDGSPSNRKGHHLCEQSLSSHLQRVPWQFSRSDGSTFDAELTLLSFRHNTRDLAITVIRDLTELRAMEEKLHQAQKLDALGQLAGGVAHDFNNMLSAILVSAEMMMGKSDEEKKRQLGNTIVSAAERAGQLTRQLLAFARKGKILSTPTDVHQIVEETVTLLQRTIDPRIQIITRLEAERSTVVGDPSQLHNALLNLCVNARDAMPAGGCLTISSTVIHLVGDLCQVETFQLEPGDYLHLCVADTGCGISEAHLQKIFEPFFTTKDVNKGTGLGLAAVFGTMASHKGAVAVESQLGVGTVFHLYLPLVGAEFRRVPTPVMEPPRGIGRLLVVDDEDLVRTATTMQLKALGYTVLSEGDPLHAMASFREGHEGFTGVLLDLVMPGISGRDVALEMHRIDPEVPIILMSGFPRNAQISEMMEVCIQGFLQKPFNRQELAELLAKVCLPRT